MERCLLGGNLGIARPSHAAVTFRQRARKIDRACNRDQDQPHTACDSAFAIWAAYPQTQGTLLLILILIPSW